jgi:hypothetical protein
VGFHQGTLGKKELVLYVRGIIEKTYYSTSFLLEDVLESAVLDRLPVYGIQVIDIGADHLGGVFGRHVCGV